MQVIIDGRSVLDEADLHRRLAGAFGYGPSYRPGLDSLRRHLGAGEPRPLRLVWTYAGALRLAIGTPRYDAFVALLEDVEADDAAKDWTQRFVFHVLD